MTRSRLPHKRSAVQFEQCTEKYSHGELTAPMVGTEKYDLAFSYAGEDRDYVRKVAEMVRARGLHVFYDEYEKADLWGKNLYAHLSDIYKVKSRYVVMFISEHYAKKVWTKHERESAQARAFLEKEEYILPVRFDDTEIPGLLGTTGYVDLRKVCLSELVQLIERKVGDRRGYWTCEADKAAASAEHFFNQAHRGAFIWTPGITAIFENRIAIAEEISYVKAVERQLSSDRIRAHGGAAAHCPWVILYASEDAAKFHKLIWSTYVSQFVSGSNMEEHAQYQSQIAATALVKYWRAPVKMPED